MKVIDRTPTLHCGAGHLQGTKGGSKATEPQWNQREATANDLSETVSP